MLTSVRLVEGLIAVSAAVVGWEVSGTTSDGSLTGSSAALTSALCGRTVNACSSASSSPRIGAQTMWIRSVVGVVLCALGALWIAQGTGAVSGSMMSGHGQYAVLGVIVVLIGVALLVWSWRIRGRRNVN